MNPCILIDSILQDFEVFKCVAKTKNASISECNFIEKQLTLNKKAKIKKEKK